MARNISVDTKKKLEDYKNTSLAKLVVSYAIDNSNSINEIAEAAEVSRMTVSNWINGYKVRDKNLAKLILHLKLLEVMHLIIEPSQSLDVFNATVIKKKYELQNEWMRIKKIIENLASENLDLGKRLVKRKYFKYFGKKMMDVALSGSWNYDPLILPWDTEDINKINSIDDYINFCYTLKNELELDGFAVEEDDENFGFSVNFGIGNKSLGELLSVGHESIENDIQFKNLERLNSKLGDFTCCFLGISWLGAENKGEDNFAWFLEWLHTPGQVLMEKIFSRIKDATSNSIYKIELPFYTICPSDYDEEGNTDLKNDYYSYRDDETSLYYDGIEIPVNQAFLREFFLLKGFKFSLMRDAIESNRHIALIDWE